MCSLRRSALALLGTGIWGQPEFKRGHSFWLWNELEYEHGPGPRLLTKKRLVVEAQWMWCISNGRRRRRRNPFKPQEEEEKSKAWTWTNEWTNPCGCSSFIWHYTITLGTLKTCLVLLASSASSSISILEPWVKHGPSFLIMWPSGLLVFFISSILVFRVPTYLPLGLGLLLCSSSRRRGLRHGRRLSDWHASNENRYYPFSNPSSLLTLASLVGWQPGSDIFVLVFLLGSAPAFLDSHCSSHWKQA